MSSTTLYEIVMLPNGDYVLRRADEHEEPLIKIHFSKDARSILQDAGMDVAKAMIDAGIDMVEQLGEEMSEQQLEEQEEDPENRVLH
jgi:predicted hydrocarbon binding protein